MKLKLIISLVLSLTMISGSVMPVNVYAQENKSNDVSAEESQTADKTVDKAADAQESTSSTVAQNAKSVAQSIIDNYGTTSIQYAVMDNGKITLSDNAGVYSKKDNSGVTADTMYGIGSVSKMFVTASIMKLVDEGKVSLDKPVVDYIPEFKMADERYKDITVRMLINHSSGLMGTEYTNLFLYDDKDTNSYDDLLNQLKTQRLKADPGAFSVYCNDGFSLAQLVVERVSGKDFTSYIHENFTEPLNMQNTKTPLDKFDTEKLAKTYDQNSVEFPQDTVGIIGTGGIYSSAEDLCRFTAMFNDGSIVSKKSAEAMNVNEAENGIYPDDNEGCIAYGLGWDNVKVFDLDRYGIKGVTKGGDTLIYHGSIVNVPEYNLCVAVLSSGGSSSYDELLGTSILKNVLKEKGIIKDILPDKDFGNVEYVQMPKELTDSSGIYMNRSAEVKIDITEDGKLNLYVPGAEENSRQTFTYTSDGYFINDDKTCECKPVKESNGNVYLRVKIYSGMKNAAQSVVDYYQLQKVDNNQISESVKQAWDARKDSRYLLINEKYTSQLYTTADMIQKLVYGDNTFGYANMLKIEDENNAKAVLQIPGANGRDINDLQYYKKDNKEYAKMGSFLLINDKDIDNLTSSLNNVKIDDDGYAKWFKVSSLDKKQMTVSVPANGAFAVYDKDRNCVNYSVVSKNNTVDLEDGYYVAFMGDKQAEFALNFK